MDNLQILTEQLLNHLSVLKEKFENNEPPSSNRSFFLFVKEETTSVFQLLEKWEKITLETIQNQNSSLHPQQITSTKENMEALLLHSYYIDVRKRRYMEMNKSCRYIFNQLIKELEDEK